MEIGIITRCGDTGYLLKYPDRIAAYHNRFKQQDGQNLLA